MNPISRRHSTKATESDSDEEDLLVEVPEDSTVVRIGVMADTEFTVGLLLAGIGYHRESFRNYLMVDSGTPLTELENFFHTLYRRQNIGLILIDYATSKRLSHVLDKCKKMLPVIVILPGKSTIRAYLDEKERLRRQAQRDVYS